MATYESTQLTANGGSAVARAGTDHGMGGDEKVFYFEVTGAAAFLTTDTINLGYMPAGLRVTGGTVWATDLDTSTNTTFGVGDAGSATRFWAATTVGQAATAADMTAVTGLGYKFTARTLLLVTMAVNATTAGTIYVVIRGRIEGIAS